MAEPNNDTVLSETADPQSRFSRRMRHLSTVAGGAIGVVGASASASVVSLTSGSTFVTPLMAGVAAGGALAGQVVGRGIVQALSSIDRREIVAREAREAAAEGKTLLLSPEADDDAPSRAGRAQQFVRNTLSEGMAVAGGMVMTVMASQAGANPVSATLAVGAATAGGYAAGRVAAVAAVAGAGLLAEARNMILPGQPLPGEMLGDDPDPALASMERERLERLAMGEELDLSDLIAERRADPSITRDDIWKAATEAMHRANEAQFLLFRRYRDGTYDSLTPTSPTDDEGWPDLDRYLRDMAEYLDAEDAVADALQGPRPQTAAEAIAPLANPDARLFAARAREGIVDPDPMVERFSVVPAWSIPEGRIVTLDDPASEPTPPDLYAVQAITAHPAVATTPSVVAFCATEGEATEAAERLTASIPAAGLALPRDATSAADHSAELDALLAPGPDGEDSELMRRIHARMDEIAKNTDLMRPVVLTWDGETLDTIPEADAMTEQTPEPPAAQPGFRNLWVEMTQSDAKEAAARAVIDVAFEWDADIMLSDENGTILEPTSYAGPVMEQIDASDRVRMTIMVPGDGGQPDQQTSLMFDWTEDGPGFISTDAEPSRVLDNLLEQSYKAFATHQPITVPKWKAEFIAEASAALPEPPMVEVEFTPQAWINDYATEVDAQGDTTFDVPLSSKLFLPDERGQLPEDDQYETDDLTRAENAPEWISDWGGPFYVTVANRDDIEAYFESELGRIAAVEAVARREDALGANARLLLTQVGSPDYPDAVAESAAIEADRAAARIRAKADLDAVALMSTRPDLEQMSLDEWTAQHHDKLTPEERTAAMEILARTEPQPDQPKPQGPDMGVENGLARILTSRWFDTLDHITYTPAEIEAIEAATERMEAAANMERDAGYRAETFFYARTADGTLGYLSEFEFDDDQFPTKGMIENFEDRMRKVTAGIEGAQFSYVKPGGDEVWNGRAAFHVFLPDDGKTFPAKALDEIALYTSGEYYRQPDADKWLDNWPPETAETVRAVIDQRGPFMDAALGYLERQTDGIADQWAASTTLYAFADEYQRREGHDKIEASLLWLRQELLQERQEGRRMEAYHRANGPIGQWANAIMEAAMTDPGDGQRAEIAKAAMEAGREAVLPSNDLREQGFNPPTRGNAILEPGTGRPTLIWEMETIPEMRDSASLWVENAVNVPGPSVRLNGQHNVIMGNAEVRGDSHLNGARVGGRSEVVDSRLIDARVVDCDIANSHVVNSHAVKGNELAVLDRLSVARSMLTDCDSHGDPERLRGRLTGVSGDDTTFAGEVMLHDSAFGAAYVAGRSSMKAVEVPHGPIMVLPKNDTYGLTGKQMTYLHRGVSLPVFGIEALRDIHAPSSPSAPIPAGSVGGWISDPENIAKVVTFRNDESDQWNRPEAWIGPDAYLLRDAVIEGSATIKGASPEEPAILDRSTVTGRSVVVGVTVTQSRIEGDSTVEPGWGVERSRIEDSTLSGLPGLPGRVEDSSLSHVKASSLAQIADSAISRASLGGTARDEIEITNSRIDNLTMPEGRLVDVRVGNMDLTGAARQRDTESHPAGQAVYLDRVDLKKVHIAPGSSLQASEGEWLTNETIPEGSMIAGRLREGVFPTPKTHIAIPVHPTLTLTGDWMTVDVPAEHPRKEIVFEIAARTAPTGRSTMQVQLDDEGNDRGSIPAVKAGDLGGYIGPDVRLDPEGRGIWIEAGGIVTGKAALHDRAFVNRTSHIDNAALHGEAVIIDSIVLDDDTVIGLPKAETIGQKDRNGFPQARPQNPVVIGTILRHSKIADVASVIAPLPDKGNEWAARTDRPVAEGVMLSKYLTLKAGQDHTFNTTAAPGIRVPGKIAGRSLAQRSMMKTRKSINRKMVSTSGRPIQNADAVRALKAVHNEITARGEAEKLLKSVAKDRKVGVIREGMDCDGVQYRKESVIDMPASMIRFVQEEEKHYSYLDGPETTYWVSPDKVKDGYYASADRGMEAFEDGHAHVLYTSPLPAGRDDEPEPERVMLRDLRGQQHSPADVRDILTAAVAYEATQDDKPITRYVALMGVPSDPWGKIDQDRLRGLVPDSEPVSEGMMATLRHMGGAVEVADGRTTYSFDPVEETALRIQDAQSRLDGAGVGISRYFMPSPEAEKAANGWSGTLVPRGSVVPDQGEPTVDVVMQYQQGAHHAPAIKALADPGTAPMLHSAEAIDGERMLVRFQTLDDLARNGDAPAFQSAVVPKDSTVQTAALLGPVRDVNVADSVARTIADRDPEFFLRAPGGPQKAQEIAPVAPRAQSSGPGRG